MTLTVGFHLIGGPQWRGGRNYLLNLIQAACQFSPATFRAKLFVPSKSSDNELREFEQIEGCDVVRSVAFQRSHPLAALVTGRAVAIEKEFVFHGVDVAFENARFYGNRFGVPTVAWLPDFQHRRLPEHFSRYQFWRREIGFRFQVSGKRTIMVSSEDARRDCEAFYPVAVGKVYAVPFAVPYVGALPANFMEQIRRNYELPACYFFLPNQFYSHKNHLLVARALRILRDRGNEIYVIATGNPADVRGTDVFREVSEFVESHGLQNSFRCLGMVPYRDVRGLLNGSRALLNPSHFEGWSTTVEEAKADGVPLLLSDIAVHREQSPEATFFDRFEPESLAEKLWEMSQTERVLTAPAELERLAQNRVITFAERFADVLWRTSGRRPSEPAKVASSRDARAL